MDEAQIRFSARLSPTEAISVHPVGPVERVRDVLIWTSGAADVSPEEHREHPPIAFPIWPDTDSPPVELGRGLCIDRLSRDDYELAMNACTARGHYFAPIRDFGQVCAFVRDIDIDVWEDSRFHWDADWVIRDALQLSRLVRDHSQSTAYAARIADFSYGEQTVVYTLPSESKHAYRLKRDRDWLDANEGAELRELLAAYWSGRDALPTRVESAMWRAEHASRVPWAPVALATLVGGLESLLKTEQLGSTEQFKTRVPALAAELGLDGVTTELCRRMYWQRSEWVHGKPARLFASGAESKTPDQGPADAQERNDWADIASLQDVLRARGAPLHRGR